MPLLTYYTLNTGEKHTNRSICAAHVCLSVSLSLFLSFSLFFYFSLRVCLSSCLVCLCLSVCLSVCPSVRLSVSLSLCYSISLCVSVYLSCLSVCLPVLSVCLSVLSVCLVCLVCLSICLFLCLSATHCSLSSWSKVLSMNRSSNCRICFTQYPVTQTAIGKYDLICLFLEVLSVSSETLDIYSTNP